MEEKKSGFLSKAGAGWGKVGEKLAKLIDVKSIVTLALTAVFALLALKGAISGSDFLTVFLIIIGFYFGTQSQKKANGVEPTQDESVAAIGFDTEGE